MKRYILFMRYKPLNLAILTCIWENMKFLFPVMSTLWFSNTSSVCALSSCLGCNLQWYQEYIFICLFLIKIKMYFEKFALHFHKTLIKAVCCLACNSDLDLMLTGQSWIEYWVIFILWNFLPTRMYFYLTTMLLTSYNKKITFVIPIKQHHITWQ